MTEYSFTILIERDHEDGGYVVTCPALQGCYTEGDTLEEAQANIREAIALHIEARAARGEPVPPGDTYEAGTVSVAV